MGAIPRVLADGMLSAKLPKLFPSCTKLKTGKSTKVMKSPKQTRLVRNIHTALRIARSTPLSATHEREPAAAAGYAVYRSRRMAAAYLEVARQRRNITAKIGSPYN